MKKTLFVLVLALGLIAGLSAQQYTRIGVVNIGKIWEAMSRNTPIGKEIEALRNQIQTEVARMTEEIRSLEAQKNGALAAGQSGEADRFNSEILRKQEAQREYVRVKQAEFNAKREQNKPDPAFVGTVIKKIQSVAELKGYSMILKAEDPNLLFYTLESDITQEVINQMTPPAP